MKAEAEKKGCDARNREAWRGGIMGKSPTRACMEKRTLKR